MSSGIILGNKILDLVFLSIIIAQTIKVLTPILKSSKIDISRVFETGGMPSSHSSSVMTLCMSIALVYGTNTGLFATTLLFAIIVMYDATGIRREAGKHAKILNEIIFNSDLKVVESKEFKQFKEFLGHTPFEVLMGALLGIFIPLIFRGYLV